MIRTVLLFTFFSCAVVLPVRSASFGSVQKHGLAQPDLRALDEIVLRDFTALVQAYERGNQPGVTQLLAGNYASRDGLGFGLDTTRLGLSVGGDLNNLRGLAFDLDTAFPQYSADRRQARMDVRWNRRTRFATSGEEWVTRNQRSTLLFVMVKGRALLAGVQGDPLIGLTNPVGTLIVDRGTIDGKPVGAPRTALRGRLGAGAQDLKSFGVFRAR